MEKRKNISPQNGEKEWGSCIDRGRRWILWLDTITDGAFHTVFPGQLLDFDFFHTGKLKHAVIIGHIADTDGKLYTF